MADTICLRVNNQVDLQWYYLEILPDKEFTVNRRLTDFLNLNQNGDTTSRKIKVLGGGKTEKAFRHAYRVDAPQATEIIGTEWLAILEVNGINPLPGKALLYIAEISVKRDRIIYDCEFVYSAYSWLKLIRNIRLCDADLGSHALTNVVIKNTWDRVTNDWTYVGGTYVPVHYGKWEQGNQISLEDVRFHIYIRHIIEVIKTTYLTDWTLESDFFDSDIFTGLIILNTADRWLLSNPKLYRATATQTSSTSLYNVEAADPSNSMTVPGAAYTVPTGMNLKINYKLSWTGGDPGTPGTFDIRLNTLVQHSATMAGASGTILNKNVVICADATDIIDIVVTHGTGGTYTYTSGHFHYEPTSGNLCSGVTIVIKDRIDCNIFFQDILRGVTQMFNLVWETNEEAKTIKVEPYDDYYGGTTISPEDFSKKVDCEALVAHKLQFATVGDHLRYRYKSDSEDEYVKALEKNEFGGEPLYSRIYDFITGPAANHRRAKEIKNQIFAPSFWIKDSEVRTADTDGSPIWLRLWNDFDETVTALSESFYMFAPRIAYFYGIDDSTNLDEDFGFSQVRWEYDGATETDWPHAFLIHPTDPGAVSATASSFPSLSFADEEIIPELSRAAFTPDGLVTAYYGTMLNEWKTGRVLKFKAVLSAREVKEIDFQRIKIVNGAKYKLTEIRDWSPITGRCILIMVNI